MSTETQRAEFEAWVLEISEPQKLIDDNTSRLMWLTWQAAQSSQAAEIEALKAKLASYEVHGVTCQTFGHVVGACAECNTHEESKEAELVALKADIATYVRAASEQDTDIEALQNERTALVKMLKTASAHLHWARRNAKCDTEEMTFAQILKEIDGAIDAAMQTKEAS